MRSLLSRLVLAVAASALCAPEIARADGADDQYRVAAGHYSQGRWQLALEEFDAFLKSYSNHQLAGQALFFSAETLVQLEKYDDARGRFADLLAREPMHRYARQAAFRKGEAALLAGSLEAARQDLEAFRQKYPDDALDAYVLPYLADLEFEAGRIDRSEALYREALARFRDGPLGNECRFGHARAVERLGQYEVAAKSYAQIAADGQNPLADRALFQLASVSNTTGKYVEAAREFDRFERTFAASPLRDKAKLGHAWALYKQGKFEEAQPLFASLVEHGELRIEARYWLGLTQKARQQFSESVSTLLAAAALEPEHELRDALDYHAGDAYFRDGKFSPALEQFDRVLKHSLNGRWADDSLLGKLHVALKQANHERVESLASEFMERFPDSPLASDVKFTRATALVALGKYDQALGPLDESLKLQTDPAKLAQCRAALVVSFAHLKRLDEARSANAELIKNHPQSELLAPTANVLAEAALAAGNRKLAGEMFGKLASDDQSTEYSSKGLSGLAWSQFKSSELAQSANTFEKLLEKYPNDPLAAEAALTRGQALEKLNQVDAALAMYHLVIDKYSNSREMPQALWKAARLHDKLEQDQKAIELYRKLVEGHVNFVDVDAALYHWAWAEHDLGHAAESNAAFEKLHREQLASTYWADATFRLAERALLAKDYGRSEKLAGEILGSTNHGGMAAHALYLQARLAMAQQNWAGLAQLLERLIKDYPNDPLAFSSKYWLAEGEYRQGRFQQAAEQFALLNEQASERTEKWLPMIPLRQAQALAQIGEWRDALTIARQIRADSPQFEQLYEVDYVIGRALASQADFAGARDSYLQVIRSATGGKSETAAMAQWMIGETYFHQENYQAALREYLRVEILYAYPRWQAGALLQAGKCHESLGEWKQAAELYARLIRVYPNTEFTIDAQSRLRVAEQHAKESKKR